MSDNTKVLVVTTTFPRRDGDDQPRFVLDLCKALPDELQQLVLAPSGPDCEPAGNVEGVQVKRFRYFFKRAESIAYGSGILANLRARPVRWLLLPFFFIGMVLALRKSLREFQPDIVHAHWWMPAGFAARIAIATTSGNHKLLITCHGTDFYLLGKRLPGLQRWVFKRSDAIALVSPAMREHAIARGLPEGKMTVAPMGVDLRNRFVPASNEDRRGLLFVGRLVEGKGVDDLLHAWAAASTSTRASGLTIIGDGSQKGALQELSESLDVADSVSFTGAIDHEDLPGHFQRATLLVFPSAREEGLGLVAIEAMGCNCPVLTADVASLSDVVIDGQTGFVYPQGDRPSLTRKIEQILASPERCKYIAAQGGDAVRARFDWSVAGDVYQSLYRNLQN